VKALTIKQPWVHAILTEGKDIENRTWATSHRGWIAIHASAKPQRDAEFPGGIQVPDLDGLDYPAICGVARIIDIVSKSSSQWFQKPDDDSNNYGWILADVTPLPSPIECNGAQKLWNVPPNIFRSIRRQLPKINFEPDPTAPAKLKLHTFQYQGKPKRGEGLRIGTTRRPPRGVTRDQWHKHFDVWFPVLAPSDELRSHSKNRKMDDPLVRERFFDSYERQLLGSAESRQAVELVAAIALRMPISIGCYCEDETRCHRSRLFTVIERVAKRLNV